MTLQVIATIMQFDEAAVVRLQQARAKRNASAGHSGLLGLFRR
jgi:hypothetical protein